MRTTAIWASVVACGVCHAATMAGPVAGYVAESSGRVLRPIVGVPGSYRFGDPVALPDGSHHLRVAPGQDYALADSGDGGVEVLRLAGTRVDEVTPVPGALRGSDWVVFSPGATAAVMVWAANARLQVITGLPGAPRVAREIDTNSLPEMPRIAAVTDDGRVLLIASRQRLYLVSQNGDAQFLAAAREIVALALFRNGVDAAVWDSAGSLHLWRNLTTAPADRILLSGLKGAGKLYPSWDGSVIFAMRPATRAVLSIDVASGELSYIDTGDAPSVLDPLRNRDTFLISARPQQPGWIFYQDGAGGRVVFVVPPVEKLP